MSNKHKRRGAETPGSDSSTLLRHAQLINERAQILGLQLQQAALATRIASAVRNYGRPTPQQQLHELLRCGAINKDLASARAEVEALKALLERVQSGRLASTSAAANAAASTSRSGAGRQAGNGSGNGPAANIRAASSKQFGALAVDHVRHWLDQAQEAVLMLEDLAAPGSIDEWNIDPSDPPPPPRPPGGPPVAHFIQRIPPELASLLELPLTSYDQPPPPPLAPVAAAAGRQQQQQNHYHHHPAAMATAVAESAATAAIATASSNVCGAAVLWNAAPLLRNPSSIAASAPGAPYRVACHESAELMWPSLAHGDLVLLLPGRYNWPEGTVFLRAAVRVLGLGRQPSDVVIHNNEEDDVFVECAAGPPPPPPPPALPGSGVSVAAAAAAAGSSGSVGPSAGCSAAEAAGVVFENLTLLQLGGYEGALRVLRGRTTLVDTVVQFTMGGLQVDTGAHLVLRNVRVVGGATAGIQVAAGGVLEMVASCEVTRSGTGDDVVPKDLGGLEVMVPLADYPRLSSPSPRALIEAHVDLLTGGLSNVAAPSELAAEAGTVAAGQPPPAATLEALQPYFGTVQSPATIVIGPGCTIQHTRGFAISLVKRRALAAYHELVHSGGGGGSHIAYGTSGGGSGGSGGGCSLAAALEGARVFVSRGSSLGPHNSRGAVGVVELEYHQLDGDAVNRRTASRHFHAVQMTARQLQEGFASPGVDWTSHRIGLEVKPARPGSRATKIEVAAAAAAAGAAGGAAGGLHGGGSGGSSQQGVVFGTRTLRQQLVVSVARAQRRQRGLSGQQGGGGGGSDTSEDSDDGSDNGGTTNNSTGRSNGGDDGVSGSSSTSSDGDDGNSDSDDVNAAVAVTAAVEVAEAVTATAANRGGGDGSGRARGVVRGQVPPPRICACCGWSPGSAAAAATQRGGDGGFVVRCTEGTGLVNDGRMAEGIGPGGGGGAEARPAKGPDTSISSGGGGGGGGSSGDVDDGCILSERADIGVLAARTIDSNTASVSPDADVSAGDSITAEDHSTSTSVSATATAVVSCWAGSGVAEALSQVAAVAAATPNATATAMTAPEAAMATAAADGGRSGVIKLRRCGGCLAVLYCSAACQRQDWPRHAPLCREQRSLAAAAAAAVAVATPARGAAS